MSRNGHAVISEAKRVMTTRLQNTLSSGSDSDRVSDRVSSCASRTVLASAGPASHCFDDYQCDC